MSCSEQSAQRALGIHIGDPETVIFTFLVPRHLVDEVASRRATTGTPGCITPVGPHDGRNRSLTQERHFLFLGGQEPGRPVGKYKVDGHELADDGAPFRWTAVAVVLLADRRVDRSRVKVIDVALTSVGQRPDMLSATH